MQEKARRVSVFDRLKDTIEKTGEIHKLKEEIKLKTNQINTNKKSLEKMEDAIEREKLEIKRYTIIRDDFLKNLLKKGRDCRDFGLSWLVRFHWNLGHNVFEENLPDFLDPKAKEFILKV